MISRYDPERTVRVYIFSFKRNEGLFQDKLSDLACLYNGVYKKILYFGQIGDALQNIVQVELRFFETMQLSDPMKTNIFMTQRLTLRIIICPEFTFGHCRLRRHT